MGGDTSLLVPQKNEQVNRNDDSSEKRTFQGVSAKFLASPKFRTK